MLLPDNPESFIYRPNYKPPEVQTLEKKQKEKKEIQKSLMQERQNLNSLLPRLEQILQKNPEIRTPSDNTFLTKYIESQNSPFLTTIMEMTNLDVARSLLKAAHIHDIAKNRFLVKSKEQVTRIIIILQGKFGCVQDIRKSDKTISNISNKQYLQSISNKSGILFRDLKRKWKASRDDYKQLCAFHTVKANLFELNIMKQYKQEQVFNISAVEDGKYTETLVSCSAGKIMSISYKTFLQIFTNFNKAQKANKISIFRKFEYFNSMENEKLLMMVDQLPVITKTKGQYIYSEGQNAQNFYILLKGAIKLTKVVELFKENPNLLYKNRETLKGASQVEHADFSEVYNYKPRKKVLELGVISDLCLFGEEEIVCQNSTREISVQVFGEEVQYYELDLKKLEALMNDKKSFLEDLKKLLYQKQSQKKILYRQEKLGEMLMLENRNNMDYFYIEEEKPYSPAENTKYKISKVNNFISLPITSPYKERKGQKAQYNIFNFTKLKRKNPQPTNKHASYSSSNLSKDEQKVMELVHTVGLSIPEPKKEEQSIKSMRNSRTLRNRSQKKPSIDIFNPLFSIAYFEKTHRENVKVEKQSRMRPLTTARMSKSFMSKSINQ